MGSADWNDGIPVIAADFETTSRYVTIGEDAVDDAAIWIHPEDPSKSLIIGTNKRSGISAYSLEGRERQYLAVGRANNVDIRYGFRTSGDSQVDIIGFSERDKNEIVILGIHPGGQIVDLSGGHIRSNLSEVYGFCFYHSQLTGKFYAIVNDKEGNVEQWELRSAGTMIAVELARTLRLRSQLEGMVADDEQGYLFIGEEDKGIWRFNAEPDGAKAGAYIRESGESNPKIKFDIEGLALYKTGGGKGYLLASSQGNNSIAVFDRAPDNKYIGSFRIAGGGFDDTRDTDGIEAVSTPLGPDFPEGILVAQDGINYRDDQLVEQNFKIVRFEKILEALNLGSN